MKTYYYVGSTTNIGNVRTLNQFGQRVELEEDLATELRKKVPLLTREEFDCLGFTAAELRQWADVGTHEAAPADFLEKRGNAWALVSRIQSQQQ